MGCKSLSAVSQVRYRRDHLSGHPVPHLTVIEDLLKDVCDGAALLTVVHFYCPEYMKLDGTTHTLIDVSQYVYKCP